jgi:serine/threonine protein kinase
VLDLLGKGGFACVYRAKCKNNGVEVAIKMVRLDSIGVQKAVAL